jgi:hypothetical protein
LQYRYLGLAVYKLVVAKRLKQIFEFRRQKLVELFR